MNEPATRWAMIGIGAMAVNIVRDFQLTENVELTTVVSRSPEKGAKFVAEWGIPNLVTDLADLWADPDIDVVYIATPHPAHFAAAKAAIHAGKHVLVEKPMTMTAAQAEELADSAGRAGVFLMEAMWMRFSPVIQKAHQLAATGAIGTVRYVEASFGFPFPQDPESRMWNPELGGGTTLDQGIYTLTLPYMTFGIPSTITATGTITDSGVDSEASVLLTFPGGQQAQLASSMTTVLPLSASICGTAGRITIEPPFWSPTTITVTQPDANSETFFRNESIDFTKEGNGYAPMLRAVGQPSPTAARNTNFIQSLQRSRYLRPWRKSSSKSKGSDWCPA